MHSNFYTLSILTRKYTGDFNSVHGSLRVELLFHNNCVVPLNPILDIDGGCVISILFL